MNPLSMALVHVHVGTRGPVLCQGCVSSCKGDSQQLYMRQDSLLCSQRHLLLLNL